MCRLVFMFIFTGLMVFVPKFTLPAFAVDTEEFSRVLGEIDNLVCTNPEKTSQYYGANLVIMIDDKRALLKNRIKDSYLSAKSPSASSSL